MQYAYDLGGGSPIIRTLKVGATVAAGTPVMHDTNHYGSVINASTTACVDHLGIVVGGGTYTATPTASTEGTAEVMCNPFLVYRARVSGSGTTGVEMTTTNLFTQTSASTTVITSAAVPAYTNNAGSTIFCLTGSNAGRSRIVTSHVDSTSVTVTVAFPATVAVGDKLVVVPYGPGTENVTLTSDFLEADGTGEIGAGVEAACTEVQLTDNSSTAPQVYVYFIITNSIWAPID